MERITSASTVLLHDITSTRGMEQAAAAQLPPHTLMQRAGLAVANLARALAPHARTLWLACGPGNNGGDGLEAAMHLQQWGLNPVVTLLGTPDQLPADAQASYQRACATGVQFADTCPPLTERDLCIDALLGIGASRAPSGALRDLVQALNASPAPVLAVDVPSGLHADTGTALDNDIAAVVRAQHTLSLLSLKAGLFTAQGRDMAGTVWLDDLGVTADPALACATLNPPPTRQPRAHASHKGSYGDVLILGGEGLARRGMGMTGAALLAAHAALHGGAGRVLVCLLDGSGLPLDLGQPELMLRSLEAVGQMDAPGLTVVCGCGGGLAVQKPLARTLSYSPSLVLDADALNAIAQNTPWRALVAERAARGWQTVLTPHPLEAARLLGSNAADIQANRLAAARQLARDFQSVVVLKGSGTVIAAPGQLPAINLSGNARLSTAGTGDVLAGLIGAYLAAGRPALDAARAAVAQHGSLADTWPHHQTLTASALAQRLLPLD